MFTTIMCLLLITEMKLKIASSPFLSVQNGDGYVDSEAKYQKISDAIAAALAEWKLAMGDDGWQVVMVSWEGQAILRTMGDDEWQVVMVSWRGAINPSDM